MWLKILTAVELGLIGGVSFLGTVFVGSKVKEHFDDQEMKKEEQLLEDVVGTLAALAVLGPLLGSGFNRPPSNDQGSNGGPTKC